MQLYLLRLGQPCRSHLEHYGFHNSFIDRQKNNILNYFIEATLIFSMLIARYTSVILSRHLENEQDIKQRYRDVLFLIQEHQMFYETNYNPLYAAIYLHFVTKALLL